MEKASLKGGQQIFSRTGEYLRSFGGRLRDDVCAGKSEIADSVELLGEKSGIDLSSLDPRELLHLKKSKLPSAKKLKEAFLKAIKAGGISQGNDRDSENVKTFESLFENGAAKPGDIILVGNNAKPEMSLLNSVLPGRYTHTGMYLGKDEKGNHKFMDAWVPTVQQRDAAWFPQTYHCWSVMRPIKPDGTELSDEERKKAVDFARSAEGCGYNFKLTNRDVILPIDPAKTKFYCSQLAWAAYYHTSGIDIDANPGFSKKYAYGVAPQELRDSKNVKVVAERDFSPGIFSKENLCRIGGGIAGLALSSYLTIGAVTGAVSAGGTILACALGAALGVWGGKIFHQATK